MPVLDWSATAAWLGIFATLAISIITPAVSTHLNNRFQLKLKESEIKSAKNHDLYTQKVAVYEGFLQSIGKFVHFSDRSNYSVVGTYLYELYLYLPPEHWELLDSLNASLADEDIKKTRATVVQISKILATDLKFLEQKI